MIFANLVRHYTVAAPAIKGYCQYLTFYNAKKTAPENRGRPVENSIEYCLGSTGGEFRIGFQTTLTNITTFVLFFLTNPDTDNGLQY